MSKKRINFPVQNELIRELPNSKQIINEDFYFPKSGQQL
jgi:hypothetical protein